MKKTIQILSVIFGAILIDQLTKGTLIYLITHRVPIAAPAWELIPVPYMMAQITNFFNIVFTWNPGASFSMLRELGSASQWVIISGITAIIVCLSYYLFKRAGAHEKLPLAIVIGGAAGNLIDRLRYGAVVDFLDFHIGGWHWPAFNIADACIFIGVALYVLNLVLKIKGKK